MKVKYILAGALVALFAVPGTASQLAARAALNAPLDAPPVVATTAGLFHDGGIAVSFLRNGTDNGRHSGLMDLLNPAGDQVFANSRLV